MIVYGSPRRRGRGALRRVSQFEVAQDFIDGGGAIDEADHLEPTGATGADEKVASCAFLIKRAQERLQ